MELRVPCVGLSPSLSHIQAVVDAFVKQVPSDFDMLET